MTDYNIVTFMPNWAFITLIILITIVLLYLFVMYFVKKPQYVYYIEDTLYDMKWKWSWKNDKVNKLYCFCPKCDKSLVYDDSSSSTNNKTTKFICEECTFAGSIPGGDISHSLNMVEREINRKVRLDTYEKH